MKRTWEGGMMNGIAGATRTAWARLVLITVAAIAGTLVGCGEQDLYKPPKSPYRVLATLPLPSINEDVSFLGNTAYVAGGQAGLHVVDLTDPSHPVLVQTINTTKYAEAVKCAATPTNGGVVGIAFVVEGTEGITTYNVSDPDSAWSYNQGTTAVDGNGLYVDLPTEASAQFSVFLAESWKGIRIFDSDPQFPGVLRYNGVFASTLGYARGISVANGYAYVADDEMGLTVLDARVRILGAVQVVSNQDTPGNARGVDVLGDYAYVADGRNGLTVMQIHLGDTPVLVGQLPLAGECRYVEVRDRYAFIAAQDGGVHIVDITNPANPQLAGTVVTSYSTGLAVRDDGIVVVADRVDGLVVLGGPGGFSDQTAPAPIASLTAEPLNAESIRLQWIAPGDDGFFGTAAAYEIRYSTQPITTANWEAATQLATPPTPSAGGTQQSVDLTGLEKETTYYCALRTRDDSGNVSAISNVASATTYAGNIPPVLLNASVTPLGSTPGSTFTFEITYRDPDNDAPTRAELVLNGESLALAGEGTDYRAGVRFRLERVLGTGSYEHRFAFDDGQGHAVETDLISGPWVGTPLVIGSPSSEPFRDTDEVERLVVFAWQTWVDSTEVTQASFEQVLGPARNRSHFRGQNLPVENVTWYDAVEYCNARSVREGLTPCYSIAGDATTCDFTANGYRLPTEAEWERACRAGTTTPLYNGTLTVETCVGTDGQPDPLLDLIGWYCGNAGPGTHPVRQKQPNPDGLYDMLGNVWEWCWDWYAASGPIGSPVGPPTGFQRVIRGGSWYYLARDCR